MTIHTLFVAPNSSCEIHGTKLKFKYEIGDEYKHYYITESGKLIVAKVLNADPLIYSSVEEKNIFSVMNGIIDSYKKNIFDELVKHGKLALFITFEPILKDKPIQFHFNYGNETVTAFQAEKVHSSDGYVFFKSNQKGWYIDQNCSKPVLYLENETAVIDGKIWYEHLPKNLQENMKLNDLSSLYDFPFPKPKEVSYPTIPTVEELLLPEYKDCKEFRIHNECLDLKLFGKQILFAYNGDLNCLNIIYTPKTKEFHVLSYSKKHMVAHSLAESIFHAEQEPYGKLFYEFYMESNCEYGLTLDDKPVLKSEVTQNTAIKFDELFNFQSRLLGNERNSDERKKLPVIFGDYKQEFVGFYDRKYYGVDEQYIRHNALFKNENGHYLLIRFSEYQVDHYDLKDYDSEEYGILSAGMTKILCFNSADDLLSFLFVKCVNQNQEDLKPLLQFIVKNHKIQMQTPPSIIFK
jgi:hypothetical protein